MPVNRWGTFKSSLASWYVEFPSDFTDLDAFAETIREIGRREDVYLPEVGLPLGKGRAAARVTVYGNSGIEEREVSDLGAELLSLRPELDRVPHVAPLEISGPLTKDTVDVVIALYTDLWFPTVVGINDLDDDVETYDNSVLAARHTPRLNRFLAAMREAAESRGAGWEHDASSNRNYTSMVDDNGIHLP